MIDNFRVIHSEEEVKETRSFAKRHFLSLIEPYGLTVTEEAKARWWPRSNNKP